MIAGARLTLHPLSGPAPSKAGRSFGNGPSRPRVELPVISLLPSGLHPARRTAWWPLCAATVVTYGSFVGVLLSLRYVAGVPATPSRTPQTSREWILLVLPRASEPRADDATGTVRDPSVTMARAPRVVNSPPRDTGEVPTSSASMATTSSSPLSSSALSLDAVSRLARPRPDLGAWIAAPDAHDPFASSAVPTAAVRESVLIALSTMVPDLAARRVPTRAERDSAAKAATLKMRLAGRPLLVPPDNSGGVITVRIPLPAGSSTKARLRDAGSYDEGRTRLRRLLARADSARRAREDSLRHASLLAPERRATPAPAPPLRRTAPPAP